jgi:O-antigen/teichoic acid export membrane protein
VAARLFPPSEVGLASGVVAAMMLCVQLAVFGVGSALISVLAAYRQRLSLLINTAGTSVVGLSVVAALLFLLLARSAFHELDVVVGVPILAVAFVAMTILGAVNVIFDNVSVAIRRGDQVLTRNVLFGLVTIGVPLTLASSVGGRGSWLILIAWTLAGLVACSIGVVQLRRSLPEYRPAIVIDRPLTAELIRIGLPNWALTMTERGPALLMPILVTELISPTVNAYWYAVWMMAWVVMIIPVSAGQTLFAEAARDPANAMRATRHGIATSLGLGVPAAIAVVIFANIALSLMGARYAAAGDLALRILVLTVLPFTVIQAYFAICRARRQLGEAVVVGTLSGIAAVAAALVAGSIAGLAAMATAWVVVQSVTAAFCGLRLLSSVRRG